MTPAAMTPAAKAASQEADRQFTGRRHGVARPSPNRPRPGRAALATSRFGAGERPRRRHGPRAAVPSGSPLPGDAPSSLGSASRPRGAESRGGAPLHPRPSLRAPWPASVLCRTTRCWIGSSAVAPGSRSSA